MIRSILCSCILVFGLSSYAFSQDLIRCSPAKPAAGEEIRVTYTLENDPFETVQTKELVVYLMLDDLINALEVPLIRAGKELVGTFKTTADTKAVFIKVLEESEVFPSRVYDQMMYDKKTGEPIPGAYLKVGYGFYYQSSFFGMEEDLDRGESYMKREFELHPDSKLNPLYMTPYTPILFRQGSETAIAELRAIAGALSKQKKEEAQLLFAAQLYRNLGADEEADKLEKLIRKRFPQGTLIKNDLQEAFYQNRGDMDEMEKIYAKLERFLDPANENERRTLGNFSIFLATSFGEMGNWEKFDKYLHAYSDCRGMSNSLNSLAWSMVGPNPEQPAQDLDKAARLSKISMEILEEELANPGKSKPPYLTPRQWTESLRFHIGYSMNTYALIQYKLGNYQEALEYQEETFERIKMPEFMSLDMYERHATYFLKVKGPVATEELLANYIQENKATNAMLKEHKRLFLANNTVESAFDKYMEFLGRERRLKYQEELKAKMLDLPAPDFSLTNIEGEQVTLHELRGKVVVLDFWATWCGPCKASFPAMQKTMEVFKDDDRVVFLFVNSWEESDNKVETASSFLNANGYTFNVPMDVDNTVVESFWVEGIPTKFIISPDGQIRFRSVGFDGDEEQYVQELEMMIRLSMK